WPTRAPAGRLPATRTTATPPETKHRMRPFAGRTAAVDEPTAPAETLGPPAAPRAAAPAHPAGHNGHAHGNGNGKVSGNGKLNGNGHAAVALGGNGHAVGLPPVAAARIASAVSPASRPAVIRVLGRVLGGEVLPSVFALLLGIAATLYV